MLPAICNLRPRGSKKLHIKVQGDNTTRHGSLLKQGMEEEGPREGWNMKMINQPPSRHDFSVLDLGFFNALQSLQDQEAPQTIDGQQALVEQAFQDSDVNKLNFVFLM